MVLQKSMASAWKEKRWSTLLPNSNEQEGDSRVLRLRQRLLSYCKCFKYMCHFNRTKLLIPSEDQWQKEKEKKAINGWWWWIISHCLWVDCDWELSVVRVGATSPTAHTKTENRVVGWFTNPNFDNKASLKRAPSTSTCGIQSALGQVGGRSHHAHHHEEGCYKRFVWSWQSALSLFEA